MNYLAHAFLSFGDQDILAGNMISDFVKGKRRFDFPVSIQNGITLHRLIDNFTDCHPATAKAKEFFRPVYRLYSGAFIDIVFDHFLAVDRAQFAEDGGLYLFTQKVYGQLEQNAALFPERFNYMFPFMKSQNWLLHYNSSEGISQSFGGLVRRATYLHESKAAFEIFTKNYQQLSLCYQLFFPELKSYAREKFLEIKG